MKRYLVLLSTVMACAVTLIEMFMSLSQGGVAV